jgi:hypothetical protein
MLHSNVCKLFGFLALTRRTPEKVNLTAFMDIALVTTILNDQMFTLK